MPGGTTSGLFNHLKKFHSDRFKKVEAQRLEEKGKRSQAGKRSAEDSDDHRSQKQMRLEDCVPGNSEALEKQIDAAMVDFLAESAVAFRVVGLPSFERLMKTANKRVTLKHRTTYSKMVKVRTADIKQEISNVIKTVKGDLNCAAFTTDMWTSDAGNPFMSLTIHFIDKNWRLHR